MSNRTVIPTRLLVEGAPLLVTLIENPTIDDVMITEARIYAASLERNDTTFSDRTVRRDIRDFLIRTGVER